MYRFNEGSAKAKAVQNLIEAWEQNKQGEQIMAMVDVSGKAEIFREATATGTIKLKAGNNQANQNWKNRKRRPTLHC